MGGAVQMELFGAEPGRGRAPVVRVVDCREARPTAWWHDTREVCQRVLGMLGREWVGVIDLGGVLKDGVDGRGGMAWVDALSGALGVLEALGHVEGRKRYFLRRDPGWSWSEPPAGEYAGFQWAYRRSRWSLGESEEA